MKKVIYLLVCLLFIGCDSDGSCDCLQTTGDIVREEMLVPNFTSVIAWERVHLYVEYGEEQRIVVETGSNLLNDIELDVIDGQLNVRNLNGCNLLRDYDITKVFITSPNIKEIRSSTGYPVESIGVLKFPELTLLSEDLGNEDKFHITGDFILDLEVEELVISANGLSKFYLTGSAETTSIGLFGGDVYVEAPNLVIQNLSLFHRSTNQMIVNPQQSIRGRIVSLGDVIAKNRPPVIDVEVLYTGRLIFE